MNGHSIPLMRFAFIAFISLIAINQAHAVPAFARQMNMECSGCHTRFPKLNAFGREFKLSGYTMSAGKQIQGVDSDQNETLSLNDLPQIAVMLQSGFTDVKKAVPDTQNDNIELPQQLSLFLAGRISPKVGSFIQMTYSQETDKFSMDNTEIRYADRGVLAGKPVTYGLTLNNNPTVEDLWNSTPAWGFPLSGPDSAPTPVAATLIDGGLGQDVAGLGGYMMWDQSWYATASLYRSAHLGSTAPHVNYKTDGSIDKDVSSQNTLSSLAPYVRLAWQHQLGDNYLEIGTYGMWSKVIPLGVAGSYDKYNDIAADFQLERMINGGQLTVHGTLINETKNLAGTLEVDPTSADNLTNKLHTARLDASYGLKKWEFAGGLFSTTGTTDKTYYAEENTTGKPDSAGWLCEVAYFPWQNVQLKAQYTGYSKFNGSSSNYDGTGRSASDNNTLFLQAWLVW